MARVELAFLAFILLLGGLASYCGRTHARFSGAERLQRIAYFYLDQLFQLFALSGDSISFNQRVSKLAFGGPVVQRQANRNTDPKVVVLI